MMSVIVCFPNYVAGTSPEVRATMWHRHPVPQVECRSRYGFRSSTLSLRGKRILMCSDSNSPSVPVLSSHEVTEKLKLASEGKQFLAMYSSIVNGITTDPASMVIPLDDHMVHRGHGVFDTAMIVNGYLYELDQHLDRIIRSASLAKIPLPFDRETIRSILIKTVSVSGCRDGSLRYWLSAGPGDFLLSPSRCRGSSLYAVVLKKDLNDIPNPRGVKVVTSSVPIKPPEFATVKSVNYLPNALSQMEAESKGGYAGIWVCNNGFVAEGPNMNVAFVFRKELVMPRFDNVLSGCTARRTLTLAEELVRKGMLESVKVTDVDVEDGKNADEMMLLGSGVLITPVIHWDEEVIGDGKEGPIAKALLDLLLEDIRSGPPSVRVLVPY